ncbi:MAG TPA: glycoside hydrolase [Abditibacteriaceae bacterium]
MSLFSPQRSAAQAAPLLLHVHTAERRQIIDNFGASGAWSMDPISKTWSEENKNRLADLLFDKEKGIGLSLWRFNIGAGGNLPGKATLWDPWRGVECFKQSAEQPYDWSRQAGQQWFLRAAKARGVEKTLAFVNSPPIWLTANGKAHCDDTTGSTNLPVGNEKPFGKFLADVLKHFQDEGLPFDYLSPINEPSWEWKGGQEGNRYNNEDTRRVVKAVDAELRAAGLKTQIDVNDSGDLRLLLDDAAYRNYRRAQSPKVVARIGNENVNKGKYREVARDLLGDPEVRRIAGNAISSHSYWTYDNHHDLQNLRALWHENLQKISPGARYWQSEVCIMEHGRDLGMNTALRVAKLIHYDLVAAQASAWHWWLAVSSGDYKDGLIYTDFNAKGGPQNILPSKTLWTLGHYSRFIRPGARRVQLSTSALPDDLLASAYVDSANKKLIVVLVNENNAPRLLQLRFDRAVGEMKSWITDDKNDLTPGAASNGAYQVPPRSVVTLVSDFRSEEVRPLKNLIALQRERKGEFLYEVRCGRDKISDNEKPGARQNRWDMIYGPDPGTGFSWGYSSFGTSGARSDGKELDSGVRYDEGDTPGQGLTYRFEVAPGRYNVEIGFRDPWKSPARKMDVLVEGRVVEANLLAEDKTLTRHFDVTSTGNTLEISVRRAADNSAPDADPLMAWIKIKAAPGTGKTAAP